MTGMLGCVFGLSGETLVALLLGSDTGDQIRCEFLVAVLDRSGSLRRRYNEHLHARSVYSLAWLCHISASIGGNESRSLYPWPVSFRCMLHVQLYEGQVSAMLVPRVRASHFKVCEMK